MKKLDVNMKVLIAIIFFFGVSLSLMAQPQRQQMYQHERGDRLGAGLDLSEEQKAEIKSLHLATMKETQPLMDEVKINKAKINAAIKKDDPDMKEIVSLVEANAKLLTNIQVNKLENHIQVRSLLTDEQKVLFDTKIGQAKAKWEIAQHREMNQHRRYPARQRF